MPKKFISSTRRYEVKRKLLQLFVDLGLLGMVVKQLSQFDNVYFQAGVNFYSPVSLRARAGAWRENMTSVYDT